ncbi:MAG TPA: lipase maturation factor family protein, partial [Candidatus Hydrogenedentes bacterium]|nr:lipase maturation factor family protein [Candidatus Hydrogenedentota bacterium]
MTHDGSPAAFAARATLPSARSFLIARWLFLRCLAALYLVTFLSLLWQIPGLLGENGISPVKENLRLAQFIPGVERYLVFPTLFWFDGSDAFLYLLCGAGVVSSALVFLGVAPRLLVPLLWLIHLSFFTVGEDLMEFQWDALLLEIGFLALFLTPSGIYPGLGRKEPPSALVLWLFRLMLFRLVFIAGAVRLHYVLLHGVTAFEVPFASQPVPTLLGWYANTTPVPFRIGLGAVVLASQLLVPFLVFMHRRVRVGAGGILVIQQLALMALGLHFMAGLLTLAVCLTLMDDAAWQGLFPFARKWMRPDPASVKTRPAPLRSFATGVVSLPIITLSAMQLLTPLVPERHWPVHARILAALTEP